MMDSDQTSVSLFLTELCREHGFPRHMAHLQFSKDATGAVVVNCYDLYFRMDPATQGADLQYMRFADSYRLMGSEETLREVAVAFLYAGSLLVQVKTKMPI